jgi:intraflagellar transport protein 122
MIDRCYCSLPIAVTSMANGPLLLLLLLMSLLLLLPLQDAYEKVGRLDLSTKILNQLTHNAVAEGRFQDAAYSYWRLAMENAKMSQQAIEKGTMTKAEALASFTKLSTRADVYHAYSMVHKARCLLLHFCIREHDHILRHSLKRAPLTPLFSFERMNQAIDAPFTSLTPETLFHAAQFLLNTLTVSDEVPYKISLVYVLYTLAKQVGPDP